jgi:hypothetical protein
MRAVVLGDKTGWIAHLPGPINRDLLPRLVTSFGYYHKLRQFAARRAMPQKRNKTRENIERSRRATRLRLGLDTRMLIALIPVIVTELTMIMIAPQAGKGSQSKTQGRQINGRCLRRRHRRCEIQSWKASRGARGASPDGPRSFLVVSFVPNCSVIHFLQC